MMVDELAATLKELLHGEYSSLSLTYNDESGPNLTTVAQWAQDMETAGEPFRETFVSEAEFDDACERNSCWTLQWYPETPNAFFVIRASTLGAIMDYVGVHLAHE